MFGGGKVKDQLERASQELQAKTRDLAEKEAQLARLKATHEHAEEQREADRSELEEARSDAAQRAARLEAELDSETEARAQLNEKLAEAQRQLEEVGTIDDTLAAVSQAKEAVEKRLLESEEKAEEKQAAIQELSRECEAQRDLLEEQRRESEGMHCFLDVAIGECEFANPFAYFVVVQLRAGTGKRSSDVSPISARPVFNNASFLLSSDEHVAEDVLCISVFANIVDPSAIAAPPVPRLVGEAQLSLSELEVPEGGTASRRVVRSVNFLRDKSGGSAQQPPDAANRPAAFIVGRATVAMQVKVLTPSEAEDGLRAGFELAAEPVAPLPAACPSLDRSLWLASPFQHRLRALVHRASGVPSPSEGNRATVRVALRLVRDDGQVLHESISTDVSVASSVEAASMTEVAFGQEVVLPLRSTEQKDVRVQITLEMLSVANKSSTLGGATTASLIDLQWPPESLPPLTPLHLHARPSASSSQAPSFARPRPALLLSLMREPPHDALDGLGDSCMHAVEVRIQGVPTARPLPECAEDSIVAICPDAAGTDAATDPQIPVATYYYDQRLDLATFVESHFRSSSGARGPRYFVTPMAVRSRTPQWGQFVLRFSASATALTGLSALVFQRRGQRGDPDAPIGGSLIGFATLDASALLAAVQPRAGTEAPPQRSFMLDLRLLEAPVSSSSLELECRVWARGGAGALPLETSVSAARPQTGANMNVPRLSAALQAAGQHASLQGGGQSTSPPSPLGILPVSNTAVAGGSTAAAVQHEAQEFRLNHELSVQLAKEFNMRAAALKRAGEEIVDLRRQVQMLKCENATLKAQLDDEEKLADEVRRRPPPEGFDSLSSAELALKLQRALDKYRDEKAKGLELSRRLEDALKEAARGRGLERTLDEMERVHLEQNKELQRLQDETKKLDTYRQTTKTQEKVIAKLEKILEGSLQEIQKAQRVQVDMERIKTENLRLREKCTNLVAKRKHSATGEQDITELRRKVAEKDAEVVRLENLVRELRDGKVRPPVELASEQRRVAQLEENRLEWEQRCTAAENRLQMLQQQVSESSKKYGGEISSLTVELARRDARILELEYLLTQGGCADAGAVPC